MSRGALCVRKPLPSLRRMTQDLEIHASHDDGDEGLNWARIAGITMAITVHAMALLLLLAPMAPRPRTPRKKKSPSST